jgi:uncharacterized protein (DUF4415 family)
MAGDENKTQAAERRLAADPEVAVPEQAHGGDTADIAAIDSLSDFAVPDDLAERLKSSGKEWQTKVEATLALWLDEASLALRKEGLPGLAATLKAKTEESRRKAESGELERDVQRLLANIVGTIGRDIAGAAIGAAFASFSNASRRTGTPRSAEREDDDRSGEDPASAA